MASEVVDTIVLSGEDSINFANNLFRPSIDFLNSNSQILASIEKNIHITDIYFCSIGIARKKKT